MRSVSLVGMPTQNTAVALTFWTIAFWVGSLGGARDPSHLRPATMGKRRWIGIVAVLCLFLAGTAYAARHDLRVARRAARADWRYNYGFYEPEQAADGRAFRWAQKRAVIALPVEAPWMRLTVSVNHSDLARNPVDVRVWVADGLVLDTTLGTSTPAIRYVRMPESEKRVVVETWVSRVMRPRDYGAADPRDLGLIVQWEFVDSRRPDGERTRRRASVEPAYQKPVVYANCIGVVVSASNQWPFIDEKSSRSVRESPLKSPGSSCHVAHPPLE